MGFQRFYLIAGAFFCVKLVGEGYAVSFRLGAPGDAGMVPLSLRETAKGGEQRTQRASLKQVSAVLQRSHPRAKRKPDPRIMHSCPDAHRRRRYCWHILRRDVSVDSDNRWAEVSLFLRVTCAYV